MGLLKRLVFGKFKRNRLLAEARTANASPSVRQAMQNVSGCLPFMLEGQDAPSGLDASKSTPPFDPAQLPHVLAVFDEVGPGTLKRLAAAGAKFPDLPIGHFDRPGTLLVRKVLYAYDETTLRLRLQKLQEGLDLGFRPDPAVMRRAKKSRHAQALKNCLDGQRNQDPVLAGAVLRY